MCDNAVCDGVWWFPSASLSRSHVEGAAVSKLRLSEIRLDSFQIDTRAGRRRPVRARVSEDGHELMIDHPQPPNVGDQWGSGKLVASDATIPAERQRGTFLACWPSSKPYTTVLRTVYATGKTRAATRGHMHA